MAIRRTDDQIKIIDSERELTEQIVTADILAVFNINTGKQKALWERPMPEVEARGLPVDLRAITFEFSSKSEFRKIKAAIDRLKSGDIPPSA